MAEKLKAIPASTPYDDERARINARLAEIDSMMEYLGHLLTANRALLNARNASEQRIEQLRKEVHLLNGGYEQ